MDNVLVLVRHGQSEWNAKNFFTGWRDVHLTEKGIAEARRAGKMLRKEGLVFDVAFVSRLMRSWKTLDLILDEMGQEGLPIYASKALNERSYGDLTGLNKDDARAKWGEEQVHIWRRSFDTPPPGGESLKDTVDRVLPYFREKIMPFMQDGKNIIISAHGNSLRALIMQIEKISADEITGLELGTGVPMIYHLDQDGHKIAMRKLEN
jgi:2,3-bisphosphoglycerate-dependent phosphoglycerate mutase